FVALRDEADLASLRSRDDFKALLAEAGRGSTFPAPTGEVARWLGHDVRFSLTALAVSADGKRALSGGGDQTGRLWEVVRGKELKRLEGFAGTVWGVAFSPDGRRALASCHDGSVRLWDLETGKEIHRLVGHTGWTVPVCFFPDGRRALSGGEDRTIRL